jgi:hypothetical protein
MSENVALRLPLPGAVVTWFVTDAKASGRYRCDDRAAYPLCSRTMEGQDESTISPTITHPARALDGLRTGIPTSRG